MILSKITCLHQSFCLESWWVYPREDYWKIRVPTLKADASGARNIKLKQLKGLGSFWFTGNIEKQLDLVQIETKKSMQTKNCAFLSAPIPVHFFTEIISS